MHEAQAETFEANGPKLKALLDAYERRLIEEALAASNGNQRRAAAALGLLPTTLHEKMKRLGLLRRAPVSEPAGFAGQMS
jgi:DNA-binding NtrC family response regulator